MLAIERQKFENRSFEILDVFGLFFVASFGSSGAAFGVGFGATFGFEFLFDRRNAILRRPHAS